MERSSQRARHRAFDPPDPAGLTSRRSGEADDEHAHDDTSGTSYRFRRLRRVSVKGYSRLKVWVLQLP